MATDIKLLQGRWFIKSLTFNGEEVSAPPNATLEIKGNRFSSSGMGATYAGVVEIDATKDPKQIDLRFDVGPEKGNVNPCIYKIEQDQWTLCIATTGSIRPRAFQSLPQSNVALEILQRIH